MPAQSCVFLVAAALLASANCVVAAPAPSPVKFHKAAGGVAGYLLLDKTPFASQPNEVDVRRAQTCKDQMLRKDPALDAPGEAKQLATKINQCLGEGSAVFTLPWLGSTPINTYLN